MPIYMTAQFEVQIDKLQICEHAIEEFISYIRENETDTLLYTSLQDKDNPTHFLHYFVFKNDKARQVHSNSAEVKRFTDTQYPNLIAPVEFTEYNVFAEAR
jgi:quinol monooxygenase YgiN